MKCSPFVRNVLVIGLLVVVPACAAPVAPSRGPWQFSGTVFGMAGREVGAPIASAQLTLTSNGELRARATSDTRGHYVFTGLETGGFRLTISAPGFATLTPAVNVEGDLRADFAMTRQ